MDIPARIINLFFVVNAADVDVALHEPLIELQRNKDAQASFKRENKFWSKVMGRGKIVVLGIFHLKLDRVKFQMVSYLLTPGKSKQG